jgi:heme-degrading monooxygenase HmoA
MPESAMQESGPAVTLINLFEVPGGADDEFIAGWERARDFLRIRGAYLETALHQSLAPEARFRFVNIGRYRSPAAFTAAVSDPEFPGGRIRHPAHPALYQGASEDRVRPDAEPAVVLINPFSVPAASDADFLRRWEAARDALREQPGYLSTRLYRSLTPEAEFRFVNVARWESAQAFRSATEAPAFLAAGRMPYQSSPALYRVIRNGD